MNSHLSSRPSVPILMSASISVVFKPATPMGLTSSSLACLSFQIVTKTLQIYPFFQNNSVPSSHHSFVYPDSVDSSLGGLISLTLLCTFKSVIT